MKIDLTKVTKKELLSKCDELSEQLAKYKTALSEICTKFGLGEVLLIASDFNK